MPVTTTRTIVVKDKSGHTIVLDPNEQITQELDSTLVCDGPRCEARHGKHYELRWNETDVQKNPESVPDSFWQMFKVVIDPVQPKEFIFCTPRCLKDWLDYGWIPPKSPRELAAEQPKPPEKPLTPHLVNAPVPMVGGLPTVEDLDAVEEEKKVVAATTAVSDATGFAE